MSSNLFRSGRFVGTRSWLSGAAHRLKKRERIKQTDAYDRIAQALGFGPNSFLWLKQELPEDAFLDSPPLYTEFLPVISKKSVPALYDGFAVAKGRTTAALALSKVSVKDWLEPLKSGPNSNRYEFTPESITSMGEAGTILDSIGFNIWPFSPETADFFFRWQPDDVREVVIDRRGEKLWIVPGGSALNAIDSILFRLRIPRPWRVTDYRGETKNDALKRSRVKLGLHWGVTDPKEACFKSSVANPAFAALVERSGFSGEFFHQIAEANDDLMDAVYWSRNDELLDDPGVAQCLARLITLIHSLNDGLQQIDDVFSGAETAALPLTESLRYAVWLLRVVSQVPNALSADDVMHITMEVQPFLQQLATVFDHSRPSDSQEFQWPPNAISGPGQTEGGALARYSARKGAGKRVVKS